MPISFKVSFKIKIFSGISDYIIYIISHLITHGGHNISDGITEALKYGQAVPEAKWETAINEVVFKAKTYIFVISQVYFHMPEGS